MSFITIDPTRCKRDGECVAECPLGLLQRKNAKETPEETPDAAELCINCGHCVAVCPEAALSTAYLRPEGCAPQRKDKIHPEEAQEFLKSRRSIRAYKSTPVRRELIEELLSVASYAPSGHNAQAVEWLVYSSRHDVDALASLVIDWMKTLATEQPDLSAAMGISRIIAAWDNGEDRILRKAPALVCAHINTNARAGESACVISLTYLELAAYASGLGACWAGYFTAAAAVFPPLQAKLNLPEDHSLYGALMLGYPRYTFKRVPPRKTPQITWR